MGAPALWRLLRVLLVLTALQGLVVGCRSAPPPSLVAQGDAAYASREYRRADALFAQSLRERVDVGPALHGRANVALALQDPESSLRFHRELARVDRSIFEGAARADYASTLLEVGRSRLDRRQPEAALVALRALDRVDPAKAGLDDLMGRALTAEGERLVMHGQREQALTAYREAMRRTPLSAAPYVGAAEILLATGKNKEALVVLGDARKHNPTDSRVRALTVQAMGLY